MYNLHKMVVDISHLDYALSPWCCLQTIPKLSGFKNKHLYSSSRVCMDGLADIGRTQMGNFTSDCRLAGFDSSLQVWLRCAPSVFVCGHVWWDSSYQGHALFMDYQSTKMSKNTQHHLRIWLMSGLPAFHWLKQVSCTNPTSMGGRKVKICWTLLQTTTFSSWGP